MNETIKIAIVDDHKIFVEGLSRLLTDIPEYEVLIEATSAEELQQVLNTSVDLLITDVSMPEMDGISLTNWVRKRYPTIKIIALSMYDNSEYIIKLFNAGVSGYLLKDSDIEEIQEAVTKVVVKDQTHFNEVTSRALLKNSKNIATGRQDGIRPSFTPRELALIQSLCDGLSANKVADKLNISVHTVNGHKERIMNKMKVHSTTAIVSYAFKNNLVQY